MARMEQPSRDRQLHCWQVLPLPFASHALPCTVSPLTHRLQAAKLGSLITASPSACLTRTAQPLPR